MFDLSKPQLGLAGAAPFSVIYGQAGIGKTTFASTPPNTVFLDVEKGIPERLRNIPRFPIESMDEMMGALSALRTQPHNWTHVVIDSVSALNTRLTDAICKEQRWLLPDGRNDMGEKGYGAFGRGEKVAAEKFSMFTNELLRLKQERNIAITALAHVRIAKVRPPDNEEYAKYDLALPAGAIEVLTQRADVVGFISYPVSLVKGDKGPAKAIGDNDARLYLQSAATHHAKNRFELPESITIPRNNPVQGFAQFARNIPFYSSLFAASPDQPAAQAPTLQ